MFCFKVEDAPVIPLPETVTLCETATLCGEAQELQGSRGFMSILYVLYLLTVSVNHHIVIRSIQNQDACGGITTTGGFIWDILTCNTTFFNIIYWDCAEDAWWFQPVLQTYCTVGAVQSGCRAA